MTKLTKISCFEDVVSRIKISVNESPLCGYFENTFFSYLNVFPCARLLDELCGTKDNYPSSRKFSKKTVYNVSHILELFRLSMDMHGYVSSSGLSKRDHACILHGDFLYTQALQALTNVTKEVRCQMMEYVYRCAYSRIRENVAKHSTSIWRCSRKYADLFKFCYFFWLRSTVSPLGINDLVLRRISDLLGRVHASAFCFLQGKNVQDPLISAQMNTYKVTYKKVLSKIDGLIGFEFDIHSMNFVYESTLLDLVQHQK